MTPKELIGPFLSLAMAVGGGALVYVATTAKLETTVFQNIRRIDTLEEKMERKVDADSVRQVNERLDRIEDKLDRVIEGKRPRQ